MKVEHVQWLHDNIFDRVTFFLWDISQWFFNRGHVNTSDKVEHFASKLRRHWNKWSFNQGWKPEPLIENQRKIVGCMLKPYLENKVDEDD